jgi:putative nucleotidyltransferase with HDIG domain
VTDRSVWKVLVVASSVIGVSVLHWVTPAGPHAWHWAHLVAQELYFVPILLSAAWFSRRGAALATASASLLYLGHVLRDWQGYPMVQAEQFASLATFWLVFLVASALFARIRSALAEVQRTHQETLTALASSLELRERYTAGHSERVRSYTLLLAEKLGVTDPPTLEAFAAGALFHDIGKIGIPDAVLLKDAPLDPGEWRVMKAHPDLGAALVGKIRSLGPVRELIRSHHERFDGTGYPRALRGAEIPLGARLFAVADSFDAMTTTRLYRPAMTFDQAVGVIRDGSGTQFDPDVVTAFLAVPFERWAAQAARNGVELRPAPAPQSVS